MKDLSTLTEKEFLALTPTETREAIRQVCIAARERMFPNCQHEKRDPVGTCYRCGQRTKAISL